MFGTTTGCGLFSCREMASSLLNLNSMSSILKKDGVASKVKKVHFMSTGGKSSSYGSSKRRPIDVDAEMVCESYSSAKAKKLKQLHFSVREEVERESKAVAEEAPLLPTLELAPTEYEVEAILDHKEV